MAKSGSIAGAGTSDTVQPLTFPAGAEVGTRKLTIGVTPSIAGTVFAALDFLTSYPYGCTEQTMSSFLPDVLVADSLKKLGVKSNIDPQVLNKQVQAGLDRLYNYQHPDGGWGWWQTDDSQAFMTAYVLAGLSQAKAAGFDVKQDAIDRGRAWLRPQFDQSGKVKTDLRAYMAYALVLSGMHEAAVLDSVWNQRSTLTAYGQALLGLAMLEMNDGRANDLTKQIESEAKQDDSQAWWPSDNNYLMDFSGDTTPETTAYALKLLDRTDPSEPAAVEGRGLPGEPSRPRLLLGVDRADGDGDLRAHRLPGTHERAAAELQRRGAGERQDGGDQEVHRCRCARACDDGCAERVATGARDKPDSHREVR